MSVWFLRKKRDGVELFLSIFLLNSHISAFMNQSQIVTTKRRNMADIAIIENRIVTLRQKQVMLDREIDSTLAEIQKILGIEVK